MHAHPLAILQRPRRHVGRVHQQLMTRLTLHQALVVVHPGVVAAYMAAADQQQLVGTRLRLRGKTLQIVQHQRRRGLDALVRRFQAPRQIRLERPEIQPVGIILQRCQAQLALGLVAVWPMAQRQVHHLLRRHGRLELDAHPRRVGLGQPDEDLPVVQRALGLGQHRLVEAGDVAHGEQIECRVVMVVLQRCGRRQDHVGIAGRLVDVEIHAEHELQAIQRLLQLAAVGRGEHRVAGHGDQRTHLPFSRLEHLFGQCRYR